MLQPLNMTVLPSANRYQKQSVREFAGVVLFERPFRHMRLPFDFRRKLETRIAMDAGPIICVIDDDKLVRTTMCATLESAGFSTVQAGDGNAGLKEIARTGARIAIIDMIMPNKEGLETVADAKRRFPAIKILAISGGWSSMPPDTLLTLARDFGADDILAKPFRSAELIEKIKRLVPTVGEAG